MSQQEVEYLLTVDIENASDNLRRLESLLMRTLSYVRRLSGNEDLDAAIMQIQKFITTLRLAIATAKAFEMASGPIGWLTAIVGAVGVAINLADTGAYDSRR